MQTIIVKILEGGKTCREVNRFQKLNYKAYYAEMAPIIGKKETIEMYRRNNYNWYINEINLPTFEIENQIQKLSYPPVPFYEVGREYSAEVLNDKKVRIIL